LTTRLDIQLELKLHWNCFRSDWRTLRTDKIKNLLSQFFGGTQHFRRPNVSRPKRQYESSANSRTQSFNWRAPQRRPIYLPVYRKVQKI